MNMNRMKYATALVLILAMPAVLSCASYSAYQNAQKAEQDKNWDSAVAYYEKALEIDPENTRYQISYRRARLEASRAHFEKGKTLMAAARTAQGGDQVRLYRLAGTELELTVRLDQTNQYAAVELAKVIEFLDNVRRAAMTESIDEMKKRASKVTKAQPPQLNPASDDPISLNFPRETPVKEIYRALGNAYGINILFDQAVKDDRIVIELRDVTAQQALERVMQAANHFYKVLDEKTIIVVPDNPQARRDYEDLVIRTFYLSNGDAEQVTNVVRTMIEARNVFPLKALNAITIRDTADKVRIAEKIIEANDKAKAEVVVDVELVQLDLNKVRDLGFAIGGFPGQNAISPVGAVSPFTETTGSDGKVTRSGFTGGSLEEIARVLGSLADIKSNISVAIPTATYAFLKTVGDTELLANPELRISEGEKATLHIGQRIPVPVTTFQATVSGQPNQGNVQPFTSYQYQDVGIKVSMEPRVHHNREVTLKLSVEVSNQGVPIGDQPTFATRTIESTIRLKDGETNFLAGLIQENKEESSTRTPLIGEIPFLGRLFTRTHKGHIRTDLVLTMTPHIIRIPDITEDDVAPMWVGTTNNITFRGVSPRIESQAGIDPFVPPARTQQFGGTDSSGRQLAEDGEPGNYIIPEGRAGQPAPPGPGPVIAPGGAPNDPFRDPVQQPVPPPPPPQPQASATSGDATTASLRAAATAVPDGGQALLRLAPRMSPQPASFAINPGESKLWSVIGMDLDGLSTTELVFRYDPRMLTVLDVSFGAALNINPQKPPGATIDRERGVIKIVSTDGAALRFNGGGEVIAMRVNGGQPGETFLVIENGALTNAGGQAVQAVVTGGRVKVN